MFSAAVAGTVVPTMTVCLGLWALGARVEGVSSLHLALVLGAIAATTAPAATMAVIHQYRASGPFSRALLGVVAVDDAMGLMIYSLVLAVGLGGSLSDTVWAATGEIIGGLFVGMVTGYALVRASRWVRLNGLRLCLVLGSLLWVTAIAQQMHFSPLLAAMCMGFVCRAMHGSSGEGLFAPIEYLEEVTFVLFFTLAGLHFQAEAFVAHAGIVVAYIVLRAAGKIGGGALGAAVGQAPIEYRKWLGFGLLPQAGVAVGLVLSLSGHPVFKGAETRW